MTTIIISLLAALGIGGGVMLASGGGSSDSGGAGVVAPVNPGDSGSGSYTGGGTTGGSTGGGTTGGSTAVATTTTNNLLSQVNFSGTTAIKPESVLAAQAPQAKLVSKTGNATLKSGKLTMDLAVLAPVLVSGTHYTTNETYNTATGSIKFMSGYAPGNPTVSSTFDLTKINSSAYLADEYKGTGSATLTLPSIDFRYIKGTGTATYGTFENMTWQLNYTFLYLGGRQLGLANSDFGYIRWLTKFYHADLDSRRYSRMDVQTLYLFDASQQVKNYAGRYANNTATFSGNIIGEYHKLLSCGNNSRKTLYGNISLTLDFNAMTLSGALSNMKEGYQGYNFGRNPSFTGKIYNVSTSSPNFKIDSMSGYYALEANGTFGEGVIVKGASKDEIVGELSFTWNTGSEYVKLAFGAKE